MKLVMENKSGYIRPLCALHIQYPHRQQPWDVSWPIENQLYLPNKEAVVKNYNEWKTESCKIEKSSGYWSVKKKKEKEKTSRNYSINSCCVSFRHTDEQTRRPLQLGNDSGRLQYSWHVTGEITSGVTQEKTI